MQLDHPNDVLIAGRELATKRHFAFDRNQFWVTELSDKLASGSPVVLHLEFQGSLTPLIVGFYKSTYIHTETGKKRYVRHRPRKGHK